MESSDPAVREAVCYVERHLKEPAATAIILGSGLAGLSAQIADAAVIPFASIPHFARSTADGHDGAVIVGRLSGVPVLALSGRLHRYEGWSEEQIRFPVRVLAALGARTLVVSNAAGGLNPIFCVGDIVAIHDHIDLMWGAPQTRFDGGEAPPGCCVPLRQPAPYDARLCALALEAGREAGFAVHAGTYLATLGPNYETRSEYRFMRRIGADVVGMSTVPEVREAGYRRMRVLALSVVSNLARPDAPRRAKHEEVLDVGQMAEPKLREILERVLQRPT